MADAPVFKQLFKSRLFALEPAAGAPGWVGFIYRGAAPIPTEIGFTASFNAGHYIFAATAPQVSDTEAADTLVGEIQAWLNQQFGNGSPPRFGGTACLWPRDFDAPDFGLSGKKTITMSAGLNTTVTSTNYNLEMGQLTLSIVQQVAVNMTGRGLNFRNASDNQIDFTTREGNNAPVILGDLQIPFIGNFAGTLTTQGTVSRSGGPGTIAYFETGFHFLYGTSRGQDERQIYPVLKTGGALRNLTYSGAIDPLDIYNTVSPLSDPEKGRYRTLFGLKSPDPIESWYRDDCGRPLALVPVNEINENDEPEPNCGALVLQSRLEQGKAPAKVYMTLAGRFSVADSEGNDQKIKLLPGLFGSELFQLAGTTSNAGPDYLQFQSSQPAFAPVFPFPQSNLEDPGASMPEKRLDTKYLTAWAALLNGPGGQTAYLAQPQGSPLYTPEPDSIDDAIPILPPLATPAAIPQPAPPAPPLLLPFAPYAGLKEAAESMPQADLGPYESQILSSERKRLIGAFTQPRLAELKAMRRNGAAALANATLRQATTPQGLFAEVTVPDAGSGGVEAMYDKVVLAKSVAKLPAVGSVDFSFIELEAPLQSLFQTNQLMAVIVNPEYLGNPVASFQEPPTEPGTPVFNHDAVIADWRMSAAVGDSLNTTAYSNILILKYCDGALTERVKNPNKWVGVDDFSVTSQGDKAVALAGLSSYLQDYLQGAIDIADAGNTLYQNFARIVRDPKWQGFLVLRAKVDPSGFPDQIKGLTAGIDFSRFEAHHFGATASRVNVKGTSVEMQVPSSLFALVDYQLPAYQQNVAAGGNPDMPVSLPLEGDFDFTVLQLQARFENASLVDFRSRIQLTMNSLFLSPIQKAYGTIGELPASAVVLRGTYQRQGETAVYVFEQNTPTVFTLQSNVLQAVALNRVIFNTLSSGADGTIRSRFLMWGTFEFATLEVALANGDTRASDILSFGQKPDVPLQRDPVGLSFSGLDVSMSSPVTSPNAVTFVFETAKLALDGGASQARDHSLFNDLALEIDGFIAGGEDKRPVDFGYLPVGVEPKIKTISGPWYGITYKVTMGSPGALVAGAGFTSRLLLAWAPTSVQNDKTAAVYTGIQLPGAAPGAKLLSIQGVLKLSIDSILLRRETVSAGEYAFVLRLNNIGLSFLGLLKLPSDPINFFLFGDPSGTGSLGWYAAYIAQKKKELIEADPSQEALPAPQGEKETTP